jgi:tetratricopeptide (TPR) repeat protein
MGNIRKAIEFYEQRLEVAQELSDRRGECIELSLLGLAYAAAGDLLKEIAYQEQCLSLTRSLDDRTAEGKTLGNLGAPGTTPVNQARRAYIMNSFSPLPISQRSPLRWGDVGNLGQAYWRIVNSDAIESLQLLLHDMWNAL